VAAQRAVKIGPFMKGLNTFSDPSAVPDDGLVELMNMELDLDGSLVSRPPFHNTGASLPLGASGTMTLLGFYYTTGGAEYLIASDGLSSTYFLGSGTWNLITDTFAATDITQFDDKAWLVSPVGGPNPGGQWTPSGGFVAEANMPRGTIIVAFKSRLWVAQGDQAVANGSRLYFSKILGVTPFWPVAPEFLDIARGDGQNIVDIRVYYESLLVFRTSSIFRFQYTADPAAGVIEVSVPGIGLDSRYSLASFENYFYFSFDDRAYEYLNGRAQEISQAIVFEESGGRSGYVTSRAVSIFNGRVLFTYYDTLYVFNLTTRTWSRWRSPKYNGIGQILERRNSGDTPPQAYAMSSKSVSTSVARNFFPNPNLVGDGTFAQVYRNLCENPNFESSIARWVAAGSVISHSGAYYASGAKSLKVTTQGLGDSEGTYLENTPRVGVLEGQKFSSSLWVLAPLGQAMYATISSQGASATSESTVFTGTGAWQYVEVLGATVGASLNPYVIVRTYTAAAINFYVDDVMLNRGSTSIPYFDGSISNDPDLAPSWTGAPNASASVLSGERVRGLMADAGVVVVSKKYAVGSENSARFIPTSSSEKLSYAYFGVPPGAVRASGTAMIQMHLDAPLTGPLEGLALRLRTTNPVFEAVASNLAGSQILSFSFEALSSNYNIFMFHGGLIGSGDVYWTRPGIFAGNYEGDWFSGSMDGYKWDGAVDDSPSSMGRRSPLLRITDEITSDSEPFTCVVRTKIFNFDAAQVYKRMFWWGVDAIFRTEVKGTVRPIVYGGSVTWGDLRTRTWGDLLSGTWGRPTVKGLSVETVRPELGDSAQRKFAKFMKKLRFRQAQFEVEFTTDGSSATAPVRLFSIHTEVTPAQAVSKAIS
jgi:hypothetical protein